MNSNLLQLLQLLLLLLLLLVGLNVYLMSVRCCPDGLLLLLSCIIYKYIYIYI